MGLNFLTHKMQIIIETFFYSTNIYLLVIHSVLGALFYDHWGWSEKMQNGRFISPLFFKKNYLFLATARRILVHQPGIESALRAVEAPSLTHWTARKVLPHSLNPLHLFISDSGVFWFCFLILWWMLWTIHTKFCIQFQGIQKPSKVAYCPVILKTVAKGLKHDLAPETSSGIHMHPKQ